MAQTSVCERLRLSQHRLKSVLLPMEQLIEQFLEHLRYERNVSAHTLRNYASDLEQFLDHLAPADPKSGKRDSPELNTIDHLTIREWLAVLHTAQKEEEFNCSQTRSAENVFSVPRSRRNAGESTRRSLSRRHVWRRNYLSIFRSKKRSDSSKLPIRKRTWVSEIGPCWN